MPRKESPGTEADKRFMEMAFAEARKVKGSTLPNPAVGAVVVKGGQVLGLGGTRPAGQAHAEIVALEKAGRKAEGATLYVTLEPCCHFGRTPPCTDAILAAGIRKVVVSVRDRNPLVGGEGLKRLREAGLEVREGVAEEEGEEFYEGFFFRILHGRPKILIKIAQSLDGRINARPGEETAITGEKAQVFTHRLRSRVDAVLVGGNTVRVDDPDLTPRLMPQATGRGPEALVLSRRGTFEPALRLFAEGRKAKTVVLSREMGSLPPWVDRAQVMGEGRETLESLLVVFKERGYHSVLIEGGREVWSLFLDAGLWDRLYIVTAPKVFPEGERWDLGLPKTWGKSLKFRKFTSLGEDCLAEFGRSES
ncbi:MAG TPA: bifunctional diaminohydroxyphosphoribosylaminopyrimidine deaminase/5-amino-6-(5-phosphoribosylamino)uracil reductase RibD [Fibrobacteria bacterium]|nr:bifunctional diaminohydroxyphosphoribosylaminopyrimidine deaminase/5-amino-6-(5-phosphoribosylamino)uracil reductase RibD [Fibrobacteria bacterium]